MSADATADPGPVPLSMDSLRTRQLRLLATLAEHCDSEGLRYYLAAGTLLGAVRHGGYIPWDDDIDVMMPREDFDRFCHSFTAARSGRGPREAISLRAPSVTPRYHLPFAKVCDDRTVLAVESDLITGIGVFIDVFPLDGWKDGRLSRITQRCLLASLAQAVRVKHLVLSRRRRWVRNLVLRVAKAAISWVPAGSLGAGITRVASWGAFDTCRRGGVIVWGYRESIPRAAYGVPVPIAFETMTCPSPADTDLVLSRLYGDYRELPPPEQRVTNHRFKAYEVTPGQASPTQG